MTTITFFNNKGGVGKTTLIYHLGHMFSRMGIPTLMVDLDPQSNLTNLALPDERLEEIWPDEEQHPLSIAHALEDVKEGMGDIRAVHIEDVPYSSRLKLIPGDLQLTRFESTLSSAFSSSRITKDAKDISSIYRTVQRAKVETSSDIVLIDIGPNFGAINHAALLATDYIVLPLAPDLFSRQGLRNLGPTLSEWRAQWARSLQDFARDKKISFDLPPGVMTPIGYVAMNFNLHSGQATKAYRMWMERMPEAYRRYILEEKDPAQPLLQNDPHCLGQIPNYQSLMPRAHEARKPIFELQSADGITGSQITTARVDVYDDFHRLAHAIAARCEIIVP